MALFSAPHFSEHEQVTFCHDPASGLKAIIAIHNTTRGPGLGGCRMWPYQNEAEAIDDVLRLSKGMSYKNALANLPLGGGKSVIIGDPAKDKSPALFKAMGRFVESLGGRYIIAEDVGTKPDDMTYIHQETEHVRGLKGGAGDPSPATAWGVFRGLEATAQERFGKNSLMDMKVAVQGLGAVGFHLCRHLHAAGAKLVVTDINDESIQRAVNDLGATAVAPDQILDQEVDIFAPCALGAVINDETIPRLKAKAVAGSANNQLAESEHGNALAQRNILYAPDYVINAGGVIYLHYEGPDFNADHAMGHVGQIGDTLKEIYGISRKENIPPHLSADQLAEERMKVA